MCVFQNYGSTSTLSGFPQYLCSILLILSAGIYKRDQPNMHSKKLPQITDTKVTPFLTEVISYHLTSLHTVGCVRSWFSLLYILVQHLHWITFWIGYPFWHLTQLETRFIPCSTGADPTANPTTLVSAAKVRGRGQKSTKNGWEKSARQDFIYPGLSVSRGRPALGLGCFVQDWSGNYQDKLLNP